MQRTLSAGVLSGFAAGRPSNRTPLIHRVGSLLRRLLAGLNQLLTLGDASPEDDYRD